MARRRRWDEKVRRRGAWSEVGKVSTTSVSNHGLSHGRWPAASPPPLPRLPPPRGLQLHANFFGELFLFGANKI